MANKQKPPRLVVFLRIVGGAGCFIGLGGIMFTSPTLFWYAAIFLYAGLLALAIDLSVEFKFKKDRWYRRGGITLVLFIAILFTAGIAFYPDRLQLMSVSFEGAYKNGESIHGITWDEDMSDLRIDIFNPTNRDFERLDLTINTGEASIRDQKQITNIAGVSLLPNAHSMHINFVDDNGKQVEERDKTIDNYNELRLLCDRLPKKTTIGLILGVHTMTPRAIELLGRPKPGISITASKPPFRMWMRKRVPSISIKGDYSALNRPYEVERNITVMPQ